MKVQQPNGKIERIDSKDIKHLGEHKLILPEKEALEAQTKKELTLIDNYNDELLEIKDKEELDKINIVGNNFLFRPFKLKERVTESGIILTMGKEKEMNRESMKINYRDLTFPYQTSGVVVKAPTKPLPGYEFLKERMVVNLPLSVFPRYINYIYKMDKNNWQPEDDEKCLTLMIPISMIETYNK